MEKERLYLMELLKRAIGIMEKESDGYENYFLTIKS